MKLNNTFRECIKEILTLHSPLGKIDIEELMSVYSLNTKHTKTVPDTYEKKQTITIDGVTSYTAIIWGDGKLYFDIWVSGRNAPDFLWNVRGVWVSKEYSAITEVLNRYDIKYKIEG